MKTSKISSIAGETINFTYLDGLPKITSVYGDQAIENFDGRIWVGSDDSNSTVASYSI